MRRSVVFVPGFGLGEPAYERTFAMVHAGLAERRPDVAVHGCYWGQEAGTRPFFNGLSIPGDGPSGYGRTGDEDGAAWSRLYQDPKHELRALGLRLSASTESGRGRKPAQKLLAELSGYVASSWVRSAFKEHGLEGALDSALQAIIESPELRNAVMAAGEDGYEHRQTFARAVVAAALTEAEGPQAPALRDPQRDTLVSLVSIDLLAQSRTLEERGDTVAVSPFLFPLLKRSWRRRGEHINVLLGSGVGDLLRYQARGDAQRRLIKKIVEDTPGDAITVIAYSFGSVACVDLMVREEVGRVDQLITVGSQVPFFYEIGALSSLEPPEVLPEHFPQQWLNIYDRRDLLSFAAAQVFPRIATDLEVDSGQPFPQAHSAYWMNSSLWTAVGMWLS
ncbi:hypothetical protein [Streptomyces sp. BK205]|uniref:hypothetical protein n=1 Tax=Streptomyces sp. BK205 TaxID=2512164 RepID=UPI001046CE76|nr:hypothetical protein [Streptomyces sp. BK205]